MIKKKSFTMVEVIISLGILTIAMFTLIGLLPAGLQNSEDTEHATHAPLVATAVTTFLTVFINGDDYNDTSGTWVVGGADDAGLKSWNLWYNGVTPNKTKYTTQKDRDTYDALNPSTDLKNGNFTDSNLPGVPSGVDYKKDPILKNLSLFTQGNYIYGGYYSDKIDGVINTEYAIRIWNGQLDMNTTAGEGPAIFKPNPTDTGVLYTIEISWPPQMEYQRRIAMGNYYQVVTYVEKH
jgi:hypothetical protein